MVMHSSYSSSYTLPRTSSYVPTSRYSSSLNTASDLLASTSGSRYRYTPSPSTYTPSSSIYVPSSSLKPRYSSVDSSWRTSSSSSSLSTTGSYRSNYTSKPPLGSSFRRSTSVTPSLSDYRSSHSSSLTSSSSTVRDDDWKPRSSRSSSVSCTSSLPQTSSYISHRPYSSSSSREESTLASRVGLQNLGNTCFMNAVLQCLCHTKPLVEYCKRGSFNSELNHKSATSGELIKAFGNLISIMWKDDINSAVSPDRLRRELQRYAPRFSGCSQQDAQELLRYLLQGMHNDINRVTVKTKFTSTAGEYSTENQRATDSWRRYQNTDDSKIVDLFAGQLKSTLKCEECNHESVTFDPFWDLSLPISEGSRVTLEQCFRLFTSPETLEGTEKPLCEKCKKKVKATKQLEIHKFPVILVIHLKRFASGSHFKSKLNVSVDFKQRLADISEFASKNCSNSSASYNLYGVVDHYGTSMSGHYTAKCKNPYTEEWNEFNDTMVSTVSTSSLVTEKAYLLFYENNSRLSRL